MQVNNNYYILREGVKRTLELAKFVQSEAKLTTTCWYYNLDQTDKERLIDLNVKAEVAAEELVRALQRYYDAVEEMPLGIRKKTRQADAQLIIDRFNARFEKIVDEVKNGKN